MKFKKNHGLYITQKTKQKNALHSKKETPTLIVKHTDNSNI